MQLLNVLTDAADQLLLVPLDDGSEVSLEFVYRAGVQRWTVNVSHPLLTLNGFNLAQGPNVLRPYRNIVPFGMSVISVTGLDPINIEDFLAGNVLIYILNAAEVAQIETQILAPVALVNP